MRSISSHEYVFFLSLGDAFIQRNVNVLDVVGTKIGLELAFKLRIHRKVIYRWITATVCVRDTDNGIYGSCGT